MLVCAAKAVSGHDGPAVNGPAGCRCTSVRTMPCTATSEMFDTVKLYVTVCPTPVMVVGVGVFVTWSPTQALASCTEEAP